jgi:hypothetical protein
MTRTPQTAPRIRPLAVMHILVIVAIAGWWIRYFWDHTPAREVYALHTARSHRSTPTSPSFDPAFAALRVAIGDVAFGLMMVGLLAFGTRPFVTRVQVWLDARTSGEAVSYGATDLETQTLTANAKRDPAP